MSGKHHTDWGSPVTLSICHHYACPCCNGSGQKDGDGREAAEYSLVIVPSHLRDLKTVPVLRLYEEELESLLNIVGQAFVGAANVSTGCCKTDSNICKQGEEEEAVSFGLTQSVNGGLGEYSLHVVGRGVDDVLLVDGNELRAFLNEVAKMKESEEAYQRRLAEEEDREREAKLRMRGKTLDEIEDEAKRASPFVAQDEQDSQVVRVLLAAAFFVGPDVERLVYSVGPSRNFITEVSIRMHDSGLWADGEVCVGHWFDDEFEWSELGLRQDCLVATGDMVKCCCGQNGTLEYCSSGRPW
jgi:hypothetical protein